MKSLLLFCAALLGLGRYAQAQAVIDTTRGRYYQPLFANVTVTTGIQYGMAVNSAGTNQTLLLDLYQPTGDTVRRRPLLIFAHQGGFISGTRNEQYMVDVCTRFAKLGYVTASIDYRLIDALTLFTRYDSVTIAQGALRGGQDMKAAVRFFRRDAATTRTYRIDPRYIAVGGASAGGFAALQVGYLDKPSEVPTYVGLAALGGIDGTSGSPGYSSLPLAVLNLSGATERADYIEVGDAPLCSLHGTADAVVPYTKGFIGGGLPRKYVVGSALLHPRATQVGIRNTLKTFRGAPHIPQYGTTASAYAYADTTFRVIRDFMRPFFGRPAGPTATVAAQLPAKALAYPVPAEAAVTVVLPQEWTKDLEGVLLDATGRVVRTVVATTKNLELLRGSLQAGIYSLKFPGQAPVRIEFQ